MTTPSPSRNTATFEPYYWEAYNEIVQPRRINHYLIRRWLPDLGPLGLAIVQVLRDRCYHDPRTGVLRDSCEIDMDELAAAVGVSRRTLIREFEGNEALGQFVRRVKQYQIVGGRAQRRANLYQVSMDEPVHALDLERYEELRAIKEQERDIPTPTKIILGGKADREKKADRCQSGTYIESDKCQIGTADATHLKRQNGTADATHLKRQNGTAILDSLPSGRLTEVSLTPAAADPPVDSPQGEDRHGSTVPAEDVAGELRDSLLCAAWSEALKLLANQVNRPTFEAHLRPLRPRALDEATGEVDLLCPSAFTREWLDKRHRESIQESLSAALGRAVTVRLQIVTGKGSRGERD